MFGTRRFENPYDPEDDGRDLEITPEEEAASDDQGRAESETFLGQMGTKERNQNDRNFRRWLLRLAKQALAEGAERRRSARKEERARAAAEAEAERRREENAVKAEKSRRAFERYCRDSDERWARTDEGTRAANAAWEAGRPAREAAERAARINGPRPSAHAPAGTNGAGASRSDRGRGQVSATPQPPAPKAAVNPASRPPTSAVGVSAGSTARQPAPAMGTTTRPTPTTPAPSRQPRPELATSVMLNPPSTLRPFTPAAVAKAARPAPPSAQPIPAASAPAMRSMARPSPTTARRPTPSHLPIPTLAASQPLPPPPPPIAPAPLEPPPFTGADLAAYRASLGLSQGALAERLGTTQGTVSKAEGNPTALLGPKLRRAMWEAQQGAGGSSSARSASNIPK